MYANIGRWTLICETRIFGRDSHEETILYIEKNGIGAHKKEIEKLHKVFNHKGVRNMEFCLGMQED